MKSQLFQTFAHMRAPANWVPSKYIFSKAVINFGGRCGGQFSVMLALLGGILPSWQTAISIISQLDGHLHHHHCHRQHYPPRHARPCSLAGVLYFSHAILI